MRFVGGDPAPGQAGCLSRECRNDANATQAGLVSRLR
jgi:hypothetical protein